MTPLPPLSRTEDLRFAIDAAVAAHGPRRVLFAVLRALFRPPPPRLQAVAEDAIGEHLRRDIGLPPAPTRPPSWSGLL